MSEQHAHAPQHEQLPHHETGELTAHQQEKLREKAEHDAAEHNEAGKVEQLSRQAEAQAISGKELTPAESNADHANSHGPVSRELKEMNLRRSLNLARRHMNAPEKALSEVMHQPIVEKVSEVAGASVARPSGILGGGLCALLGSALLLYITKHYGYQYNYLVFTVLFVGGFALGLLIEAGVRLALLRRR